MTQDSPDLGEKALSKVAEVGITSQLDDVEELNVDIRTNPVKLVQGEVDSVTIEGKGIVMQQDLRMESLEVNTSSVAINPLSAVFGDLQLTQPTDAEAQVVLLEDDINHAFTSDYLRGKLRGLKMEMNGQPITVNVQRSTIHLPGEGKLVLDAEFMIIEQAELKKIKATMIPRVEENGHRIALEILSAEGEGLTPELIRSVFDQIINLLDLRNFDIPGMSLQLHRLEPQVGQLVIHARTQIEQIPSA